MITFILVLFSRMDTEENSNVQEENSNVQEDPICSPSLHSPSHRREEPVQDKLSTYLS